MLCILKGNGNTTSVTLHAGLKLWGESPVFDQSSQPDYLLTCFTVKIKTTTVNLRGKCFEKGKKKKTLLGNHQPSLMLGGLILSKDKWLPGLVWLQFLHTFCVASLLSRLAANRCQSLSKFFSCSSHITHRQNVFFVPSCFLAGSLHSHGLM